jgi:hypothetical protein
MRASRLPVALIAALVAVACAPAEPGKAPGIKAAEGAQRTMLSEGYSMLYTDASHMDMMDLVLYVKLDSKEFNQVITSIADAAALVKHDLERIAHDYPGVRIDLKPLPEMETRKRFAIAKDRMLRFAPLSGHGRQEFERTMLIGLAGALNHESHLCRVMAAEEPDAGLKKFLQESEQRYAALGAVATRLLEREYFKTDTDKVAASEPRHHAQQ